MKKTKMLIAYVALLAAMPIFIYLSGCAIVLPALVCSVLCEDECNALAELIWCPTICETICRVEVDITSLPSNCRVSSGLYLETNDGTVYLDDRDPISGRLISRDHTNGTRTVDLVECYDVDLNDPQAQLDAFIASIANVSYLVEVCQTNSCEAPPIPEANQTLLISLPSLQNPWTFDPDPNNCLIRMTYDASQLTEVQPCTICCS